MTALLTVMADALVEEELGPDVSFALFVDWRDSKPLSYVSNIPRPRAIPILDEWLEKTANPLDTGGGLLHGPRTLQAKCAEVGKSMVEEGIDVVLFLVTWGEAGEVAWFSSMPAAKRTVRDWVQSEKRSGS
jgi:hypothetical protein